MTEHNKTINQVASAFFTPLNIRRKGKSRFWLEDNGWFLTIIEFQPSSHSRGTYLNLGVCFNDYPNNHFSFDLGGRREQFIDAENINEFETKLSKIIRRSIPIIGHYQEGLIESNNPGEFIIGQLNNDSLKDSGWSNYHIGFAYLIRNQLELANKYLELVVNSDDDREWAKKRADYARDLMDIKNDLSRLTEIINGSRELKKLEPLEARLLFPDR